jgi:hypothetical protein
MDWCSVPDFADQYCNHTHSATAALGIAPPLRWEHSSAELEQPLQVGGVASGAEDEAVLDLQYERRGEHLLDAGGGDAQELALGTAVSRPKDDLVTLGDHIVDRPLLRDGAERVE